jgi:hypothetical protein
VRGRQAPVVELALPSCANILLRDSSSRDFAINLQNVKAKRLLPSSNRDPASLASSRRTNNNFGLMRAC